MSIISEYNDGLVRYCQEIIGQLPKDFFLQIIDIGPQKFLDVQYSGPSFAEIVPRAGKIPGPKDKSLSVGYINLTSSNEEVVSFVKSVVLRTQEKLKAVGANEAYRCPTCHKTRSQLLAEGKITVLQGYEQCTDCHADLDCIPTL